MDNDNLMPEGYNIKRLIDHFKHYVSVVNMENGEEVLKSPNLKIDEGSGGQYENVIQAILLLFFYYHDEELKEAITDKPDPGDSVKDLLSNLLKKLLKKEIFDDEKKELENYIESILKKSLNGLEEKHLLTNHIKYIDKNNKVKYRYEDGQLIKYLKKLYKPKIELIREIDEDPEKDKPGGIGSYLAKNAYDIYKAIYKAEKNGGDVDSELKNIKIADDKIKLIKSIDIDIILIAIIIHERTNSPSEYKGNNSINRIDIGIEYFLKFSSHFIIYWRILKKDKRCFRMQEGDAVATDANLGENKIFYGVPGCGKSHQIQKSIISIIEKLLVKKLFNDIKTEPSIKYLEDNGHINRVVFHPDYTYSDFVGQILPTVDDKGNLKYEFKPGPFTRILKEAVKKGNEDKPYFLIIEEINRGNAAAIFGDLFQLLDRKDNESEYPIINLDIAKTIYEYTYKDNKYTYKGRDGKEKTVDEAMFAAEHTIKIPKNLWIFATMNTSDQNVFTIDTAFQRRWKMEYIKNDFSKVKNFTIDDTGILWKEFAITINKEIKEHLEELSNEDKQLGAFFIQSDNDVPISREDFANKVIKYLWDDVCKFQKSILFKESYKTLGDVIKDFTLGKENDDGDKKPVPVDLSDIFKIDKWLKQGEKEDDDKSEDEEDISESEGKEDDE